MITPLSLEILVQNWLQTTLSKETPWVVEIICVHTCLTAWAKSLLGLPTSHTGVPGLSPGSTSDAASSSCIPWEVPDDDPHTWIPAIHIRANLNSRLLAWVWPSPGRCRHLVNCTIKWNTSLSYKYNANKLEYKEKKLQCAVNKADLQYNKWKLKGARVLCCPSRQGVRPTETSNLQGSKNGNFFCGS